MICAIVYQLPWPLQSVLILIIVMSSLTSTALFHLLSPGAVAVFEYYSESSLAVAGSSINCNGNENKLLNCGIDIVNPSCVSNLNDAGVACAPLSTESDPSCQDGQLRLVDGGTELEGRVEVCINRAWGTVCSTGFSEDEAEVVCSQIGVLHNGEWY